VNVAEWIRRNAAWHPSKLAYIDGSRTRTFQEFYARACRQVNALDAMGVNRGDRVAVMLNNGIEAVEAFGAAALGAFVHVPINFRYAQEDVEYILRDSGSKVLIIDASILETLDEAALRDLCQLVVVDLARKDSSYERWLSASTDVPAQVDVLGTDDLLIAYTSGTTGDPKGALFQHHQSVYHAPLSVLSYEMEADSRLLVVYPHNSIASINVSYVPAMSIAATVVLCDVRQFSAQRWLELVQLHQVTHCALVPTMLFRILEHPGLREYDLSCLKTVGYGSAPMPRERIQRLSEVFGNIIVQGYGMTEIASLATFLTKRDHAEALSTNPKRLESCGRPLYACEVRLLDDDGKEVPAGEVGEISFRGPQLMSGYWNAPERTKEAIRNGWLRSGDMAYMDAEGYLYIVDRKKDLIICGGANIASREVEEALYSHPAVREAAVVGRPDDEWGERVHAFVALHEGMRVDERELIEFMRERLARYKCPDRIEFLPELPKNALGKFLKSSLRKPLWAGRQRAVN
jgi:acyl-CoA synthetase (AMP-forming)/AMP-acid ligase II